MHVVLSIFIGCDIRIKEYFILSKSADSCPDQFGVGGQVDFILGHDSDDTSAFGGLDGSFDNGWTDNDQGDIDNVGIAMPQIYASFYAPIGNGVTVDVGHFYTIIGWEVVTAPDNFFYSHAYTMVYSEPFTHTGALATLAVIAFAKRFLPRSPAPLLAVAVGIAAAADCSRNRNCNNRLPRHGRLACDRRLLKLSCAGADLQPVADDSSDCAVSRISSTEPGCDATVSGKCHAAQQGHALPVQCTDHDGRLRFTGG